MAVWTQVPQEALDAFLLQYSIGRTAAFKGIAEGVENSNFMLATHDEQGQRGRYILTLFERRVAVADLPYFLGLTEHLASNGFTCPRPIRARDGSLLQTLQGRPAVIVEFLDGLSISSPTPDHAREVGAALARLHLAGQGFSLSRANDLGPARWRAMWPELAQKARALPLPAQDTAFDPASLAQDVVDALDQWPTGLPSGHIHADLFPDNAFFRDNRFAAAIDFYFACQDLLAYDICVCLNAWGFSEDGRTRLVENQLALLAGYQQVRPLSPAEREALPLLGRGAALRFFLTRLADWGPVEPGQIVRPKDPLAYARRMAAWAKLTPDDLA